MISHFPSGTPLLHPESSVKLTSKNYEWTSIMLPFLFPALGAFMFGYDTGATSSARLSIESPSLSGTDWYALTSVEIGLMESGSLFGAFAGSLVAFIVADLLGRRRELLTASFFYTLGLIITSAAQGFVILLIGRLIYGLGIGMSMHAAPMYIAETSPVQIRGRLISAKEAMLVLGMLCGYVVGYFAIDIVGGWRIMYGVATPISLIMTGGLLWLPPSPRWILLRAHKGKANMELSREEAVLSICRLMGKNADENAVQEQLHEIVASLQRIQDEVHLLELFRGTSFNSLLIGVGLVLFQQFTGQPSVLYYAATIFQDAGFQAASRATRVSIFLGVFKILMTLVAVWKVDQLGRRPLLLGGVGVLTIAVFALSAYYGCLQGAPVLAMISLLLYVGAYQVSFGPIGWIMLSEIFPLQTRAWALSITVLLNFAANAVVTFSFSPLEEELGMAVTFAFFGCFGLLSLVFIALKIPETKGLSLEEVQAKLTSGSVP